MKIDYKNPVVLRKSTETYLRRVLFSDSATVRNTADSKLLKRLLKSHFYNLL